MNRSYLRARDALGVAIRRATLVVVAAILSPLACVPAYAAFSVDTTDVVSTLADGKIVITYTVQNTSTDCISDAACAIAGFSLPEYTAGDIDFNAPDAQLPHYCYEDTPDCYPLWYAYEDTTVLDPGTATLVGPPAAAYVHLTAGSLALGLDTESFIYPGESLTFTAVIPTTAVIGADFGYFVGPTFIVVDPDIPDTRPQAAGVPEPSAIASLGIGGLAALLARRRRKS